MFSRLLRGMALGLLFGLIFVWAETLSVFVSSRILMEIIWPPFTAGVLILSLLSLVICTVLGGLLALLPGPFRTPSWNLYRHAMPVGMVGVAMVAAPMIDQMVYLNLAGIGLAHLASYLLGGLKNRLPRLLPAGPVVLAALWAGAVLPHVKPSLEHGADPNRPRPPAGAMNVLWVVFDTVRADHLSLYGHSRETTPNLTKLASEGVVFNRAYSTAPWTVESHGGMFTGLYSIQHGCTHANLYLDGRHPTVAGELTKAGYETALFGGNMWLADFTGLARGFQYVYNSWQYYAFNLLFLSARFRSVFIEPREDKAGRFTNPAIKEWMDSRDKSRPFFAFVNYLEAHAPYHHVPIEYWTRFLPPDVTPAEARDISLKYGRRMVTVDDYEATPREREIARATYDGALLYTDHLLGQLIEQLRQSGELENTLVIVNADHGEMFGEHGVYGHDVAIYHPLIHVPMVMRLPGNLPAGTRIETPVQLIDIFPTLFAMAGLEDRMPPVHGRSLLPVLAGQGDPQRPMISEYYKSHMRPMVKEMERHGFDPETFNLRSVVVESMHLIKGAGDYERLYDVAADPEEEKPLQEERVETVQALREELGVLDALARGEPMPAPATPVETPAQAAELHLEASPQAPELPSPENAPRNGTGEAAPN